MGPAEGRSEAEDEQALRAFVAGDTTAFEPIVRRHQDRVFRLALAFVGDREDARDAAQEVFLRAFRELGRWRFEARLSTWLFRVTVNVSREVRRRRMRDRIKGVRWLRLWAPLLRSEAHPNPGASEGLRRMLEALPPRQREVVALRILEDLSVRETAAALGVPEGTVKSNFFKGVENLRSRLRAAPDPNEREA